MLLLPVSLMSDKPLLFGGNGKAPVRWCCRSFVRPTTSSSVRRPAAATAANNALISEEWSCQFLCPGVLLHPGSVHRDRPHHCHYYQPTTFLQNPCCTRFTFGGGRRGNANICYYAMANFEKLLNVLFGEKGKKVREMNDGITKEVFSLQTLDIIRLTSSLLVSLMCSIMMMVMGNDARDT